MFQIISLNSIVCFTHIMFDRHKFMFAFIFYFHEMNKLMYNKNIVNNLYSKNKSTLRFKIKSDKKIMSLLAMALEINLLRTLQRLIG